MNKLLKLNEAEIKLVVSALNHIYNNRNILLESNGILWDHETRKKTSDLADSYLILADDITNGRKDVL